MNLLEDGGILAFISSNKWMRASYGKNLRKKLKEKSILKIIDFGGYPVFEQSVDTCIVILKNKKYQENHEFYFVNVPSNLKDHKHAIKYIYENQNSMKQKDMLTDILVLEDRKILAIKEKIEKIGKPLKDWNVRIYRGVLTGFNEAFIIDTETREKILENCLTKEERERTEKIIKPVLRGRDIQRYYYEWKGLWLIGTFPSLKLDIENYPSIKKYFLDNFDIRLLEQSGKKYPMLGFNARKKTSNKWFETQDNIAYYQEFEKEKIIWQEMTRRPSFSYDSQKFYTLQTCYILTGDKILFLLAVLNSIVSFFYLTKICYSLSDVSNRWIKQYVERIPIPEIREENKILSTDIQELASKITKLKQSNHMYNTQDLENQIDDLVFKLYNLTDEEGKIVRKTILYDQ
ncbi:MAG: TaqI-like C-terminal specificity domain-containing protein [bacterium]